MSALMIRTLVLPSAGADAVPIVSECRVRNIQHKAPMGGVVAAQVQACLEFLRPVLPAEARERLERKEKMEEGMSCPEQYHIASMQHTLRFLSYYAPDTHPWQSAAFLTLCASIDSLGGTFIKRSFTFGGFSLSSQSISMHVRTSEEPVALLWRLSNDESATWNEIHASDIKTIDGKGKSRHPFFT